MLLYSEQRMWQRKVLLTTHSPVGVAALTPVQSHSTRPGPDSEINDPGILSESTPAINTIPMVPDRSKGGRPAGNSAFLGVLQITNYVVKADRRTRQTTA